MSSPELAVALVEVRAAPPFVALSPHLYEVTHLAMRPSDEVSDDAGTAEISEALRRLCDAAYQHNLRVEQLLILIKAAWPAVAGPFASSDRSQRNKRLDRVVTLCIEEFYRSRD